MEQWAGGEVEAARKDGFHCEARLPATDRAEQAASAVGGNSGSFLKTTASVRHVGTTAGASGAPIEPNWVLVAAHAADRVEAAAYFLPGSSFSRATAPDRCGE